MTTASKKRHSHHLYLLIAIVAAGFAVRLVYLLNSAAYPNFYIPYAGLDAEHYHLLARQVAAGDLLLGPTVYFYSPSYAYFLGFFYFLFGSGVWVAHLLNLALGTATLALMYLYTDRLFESPAVAALSTLGAALYGPFVVFDTSALKTTLGLFLLALTFFLISRGRRKPLKRRWFPIGFVLGLAFNLIGQLGLFIVILAIWIIIAARTTVPDRSPQVKAGDRLSILVFYLLGLGCSVLPFTLRNAYVADDPVLTTSTGGIHFYIGNNPDAWGGYTRIDGIRPNPAGHFYDARRIAEQQAGRSLAASQVSAFWRDRAYSYMLTAPGDYLKLLGKKARLLVGSYEIPNNENFQYLTQRSTLLSCLFRFGLLLPLGLSGLLLSLRCPSKPVLLYLFALTYSLAVVLTLVNWRYRLPLTLALWPFAGYFVVFNWDSLRRRRWPALVAGLLLLAGFAALGQFEPVSEQIQRAERHSAEKKMNASAREHQILQTLAHSAPAERGYLYYKLARLRRSQSDVEGAIRFLEQALSENPNQPGLQRYLSDMYRQLGWTEGVPRLLPKK